MAKPRFSKSRPIPQASAIPFRWRDSELEVCLITSRKRKRWGFPKGIIEPGETYAQTALKETYEEAGLHGEIISPPIGEYHYQKWGTTLRVVVVAMHVHREDADWPEARDRERRWVPSDEAHAILGRSELRPLLDAGLEVMGHVTS